MNLLPSIKFKKQLNIGCITVFDDIKNINVYILFFYIIYTIYYKKNY